MKLTPVFHKNLDAYDAGYRTIVNKGTARSGKTRGLKQLAWWILNESSKHKKWSTVSHSFPHLQQGAMYELEKHISEESISNIRHHQGKKEYYINKSILNYFSLDVDGNKAIGPGRDILFLNEPNRGITLQQYIDLKARTTECVFLDYNPSGEFWLHEEKIIEDPRTIVIHSSWLDNLENLTDAQVQDFLDAKAKAMSGKYPYWKWWWEVYGEGKDSILLEERVMPIVNWCSKIPKDAIQIPHGLDFGFYPDPTAFVRLWVVPKKKSNELDKLYVEQLVYDTKLSINSKSKNLENLVDKLKRKKVNFEVSTIAECADPLAIEELRGVDMEIEAVSKISVEASVRLFHDYEIYVLDGGDDAYKEFNGYKFARDKRTGKISHIVAKGQDDHIIDATRYVLLSRNSRWDI